MNDHCTACHETFDESETIIHQNGADECPYCHEKCMCIGIGDNDVCPGCVWDCQLNEKNILQKQKL